MMSSTSLINFSMGPKFAISYSLRAMYGTVGTLFALSSADISKCLFDSHHNIDELAKTFPDRVNVFNNVVYLKGPVLISDGVWSYFIPVVASLAVAVPVALLSQLVVSAVSNIFKSEETEARRPRPPEAISGMVVLISAATFCGSLAFLYSRLPMESGVHLLNWSFQKIN